MATQSKDLSSAQCAARRKNSRKSTGPRSCRGKRRSSRNALKHGLYSDVRFFCQEAAMELGEDPNDFTRLYRALVEARPPANALEQVLIEDITVLIWKKARLERSESAVQVCNVRKHDLERLRQSIQVDRDVTSVSQAEVFEKGLRVMLDAPGKFEKVISMMAMLEDLTERHEFNDDMHRLLLALYGKEPTLRGAGLLNQFVKLRKMRREGQEFENAKTVFGSMLADEHVDILEEYELYLHEHVENTRAARIAAMAPSTAQWAAIIRQQNALHRQMERKIRLLDEMQERRRRSASDLLEKLMPPGFHGGGPAPTTPSPSSSEEGSPSDPAPTTHSPSSSEEGSSSDPAPSAPSPSTPGVAHTSGRSLSGCMRPSPETEQPRDADMPNSGTPAPPVESATNAGREHDLSAPQGAEESSPGREPWVEGASPRLRHPSPAGAGEGRGERVGAPTHGSRHGLLSDAPCGAVEDSVSFPSQQGRDADMPHGATPAPPTPPVPDENTQNRGNEAKKSLKTNEVTPADCANQTHFGAQNARNEAKFGPCCEAQAPGSATSVPPPPMAT